MKRIVIATDGSDAAEEALEVGLELAQEQGARAWLVHARPPADNLVTTAFAPAVPAEQPQRPKAQEDEVLQHAAAIASDRGVEAELVARFGYPAATIVAAADEVGADLIVIGSRGLGALGRVILGSVSREVLRDTRRPVLVVRSAKVPAVA